MDNNTCLESDDSALHEELLRLYITGSNLFEMRRYRLSRRLQCMSELSFDSLI